MTAPLCECHGKPMQWDADKRRPPGGYWVCRVRKQRNARVYEHSRAGRERRMRENVRNRQARMDDLKELMNR